MSGHEILKNTSSKPENTQNLTVVVEIPLGVNPVGYPAKLIIFEDANGTRSEKIELLKKEDR